MLGDSLDVSDHCVSLLVEVLLAKAESHIQQEERLDGLVQNVEPERVSHSEGRVVGVSKNIVARNDKHENVEPPFPGGVVLDHEAAEDVLVRAIQLLSLRQEHEVALVNLLGFALGLLVKLRVALVVLGSLP